MPAPAAVLAKRAGRRVVICTAGILGCLTALAFALFADQTALILILGATFQFFGMLTNTTLAAWSPKLYPTRIRTLGTSIVNGIGNIGGAGKTLLAPGAGGSAPYAFTSGLIRESGTDPASVTFVRDLSTNMLVELYQTGLGDGIIADLGTASELEAAGYGRIASVTSTPAD